MIKIGYEPRGEIDLQQETELDPMQVMLEGKPEIEGQRSGRQLAGNNSDASFPPRIISVRIDTFNFQEVMQKIKTFMKERRVHTISTVNPEFVMTARKDREFLHILNHADINVADGTGVQLAAKILYGRRCERITGVDLTWALAKLAAEEGWSIYFLGSAEGIANKAALRLREKYSDLKISGCHSGSPTEEGLVDRINAAGPDILLVAFGAPKQEKFIFRNRNKLNARLAVGVGGTFDYIAEAIPRAPAAVRQIGLEWLYRLINQPERFQRILTATVGFPIAAVADKLRMFFVSQKF